MLRQTHAFKHCFLQLKVYRDLHASFDSRQISITVDANDIVSRKLIEADQNENNKSNNENERSNWRGGGCFFTISFIFTVSSLITALQIIDSEVVFYR